MVADPSVDDEDDVAALVLFLAISVTAWPGAMVEPCLVPSGIVDPDDEGLGEAGLLTVAEVGTEVGAGLLGEDSSTALDAATAAFSADILRSLAYALTKTGSSSSFSTTLLWPGRPPSTGSLGEW